VFVTLLLCCKLVTLVKKVEHWMIHVRGIEQLLLVITAPRRQLVNDNLVVPLSPSRV